MAHEPQSGRPREEHRLPDEQGWSLAPAPLSRQSTASNDALNIREDFATPISIPEYVNVGQNKPAAYVKNQAATIGVRIKVGSSAITSLKIKGVSDDTDGSFGDAQEKIVSFSDGVSHEGTDDPATPGINESEFAKFIISGNTPNKVQKSKEAWKWYVIPSL